jgi:pimeloyl-ACP methyl ester carboxylesterase
MRVGRARRLLTVVLGAVAVSTVVGSMSAAGARDDGETATADVQLTPITQSVPTPPRWFPGDDGRVHLQYEVVLTNTIPLPVDVTRVQVLGDGRALTALSGAELAAALTPLGSEHGSGTTLAPSSSAVVWVDLTLESAAEVPSRVGQQLTVDVGPGLPVGPTIASTGGRAVVDRREPVRLDPPLRGGPWVAVGGPHGPHRRALQAVDGELRSSQRFAVDFSALLDGTGRTRVGDADEDASYFDLHQAGPRLHLQVMDRPSFLAADDLPFVISRSTADGTLPSLEGFAGRARPATARGDVTGLVDVGGGRELFVECRGSGSPTVVLISGKGTDAADWMQIADPADPALHSPNDDVGAGLVKQVPSDDAVLPSVARFTRVCAYDRPDTRLTGADRSTPRAHQPHTLVQDVRDLHALLGALDEAGPSVLVPHSYGGWIAELYARTYPKRIGGLVMVDAATALLRDVMTPSQLTTWDTANRMTSPQLAEGVRVIDAIKRVRAAGPMPKVPAIVLSADKPYRTGLLPAGTDPDASLTFASWLKAQDRLAAALHAKHVTATASGHHVYLYSPGIVVDAIRTVVDDVRRGRRGTALR